MRSWRKPVALVDPDAGGLHHLAPARHVGADLRGKLLGGVAYRLDAPDIYACKASIADFGFDATIFSRARAGPVGRVRRCSQFCKVRRFTPISSAN